MSGGAYHWRHSYWSVGTDIPLGFGNRPGATRPDLQDWVTSASDPPGAHRAISFVTASTRRAITDIRPHHLPLSYVGSQALIPIEQVWSRKPIQGSVDRYMGGTVYLGRTPSAHWSDDR